MMSSSTSSSSSSSIGRCLAVGDATATIPTSGVLKIHISVDIVAAAKHHLSFIKSTYALIRHPRSLLRSIRRYEALWMPLISHISADLSSPPFLLPPVDVQCVWLSHCLSPRSYRDYCVARFGSLIERPAVFDEENEEYASDRCRELWTARYPSDPFDLEGSEPIDDGEVALDRGGDHDLLGAVRRNLELWSHFSDPFLSETVFLVLARQRYCNFLHLCRKATGSRLAPTSDVMLMWMIHQSFPGAYWRDTEAAGLEGLEERIVGLGDAAEDGELETTRRAWEEAYDEPFERAGGWFSVAQSSSSRAFFYWEQSPECDVNREYKSLKPRFLMEVQVHLKWKKRLTEGKGCGESEKGMFLRLRMRRCHREMRLEMPMSSLTSSSWQKVWKFYCEFATQGIVLELRRCRNQCLGGSKVEEKLVFQWNDLLRASSLSLSKEFVGGNFLTSTSITAPVRAPYLLKCVPDRVTDDDGAMISDVVLRMNGHHPQKGRWLSRTVLDPSRRECFVIRIRVAEGFWRRGAETPQAVKWEDRVIEVRQGAWSYLASSVGNAPVKVLGTATPKEVDRFRKKMTWVLSSGHLLTVQCGNRLGYQIEVGETSDQIKLVRGRKLHYQPKVIMNIEEEEEHYATLIRATPGNPEGKATALINWRLFAVEFLPEEDAVVILLLCTAIVRSISEMTRKDVGWLLLRRRVKETKAGIRDWGSVMLHSSLPQLQPWFWNAGGVLACPQVNDGRQPLPWYSAADGKEEMYKEVVLGPS